MTDLVVMSLEMWDDVWRRNQHLVAGLLRGGRVDRVLFVEPPVDALHQVRSGRRPDLRRVGLRTIELSGAPRTGQLWGLRPVKVLPRRIDGRGDRRRAEGVARAARKVGMEDPVLWVNDPGGAEVLAATGWNAFYDMTDDWLAADRSDAELERLRRQEDRLMSECREVVVCSVGLERTRSELRDVVLVPNGVDLEPYRVRQPRPSDLGEGRIALYLGTAHRDRLDVELVVRTAEVLRALPEGGRVLLVGPAPLPRRDLDRLERAGVALLGPRPSDSVPAYLQHADVLLVPHVLSEFTASLDPIKAYEYRAARRPVIATPVPGFVDVADPLVRAVGTEDFPAAVAEAFESPVPWSPTLPRDLPSWLDRVAQLSAVLDRVEAVGG